MSTTSSVSDPMEAEIERALAPGRFVSDRGCFRFVDGLEQVAATVGRLVDDVLSGAENEDGGVALDEDVASSLVLAMTARSSR